MNSDLQALVTAPSEVPVWPAAINTTPHLNRSRVKRTILEVAAQTRKDGCGKPRFTRVSASFLERIEAHVRNAIKSEIHQHPSVGRTLK